MSLESYHSAELPDSHSETIESSDRYAAALARIRTAQEHASQAANKAHGVLPPSPTLEKLTKGVQNDSQTKAADMLHAPTTAEELVQRYPGMRVNFVPHGTSDVTQVHEENEDPGAAALGVFTGGFAGGVRNTVSDSATESTNVRFDALVTLRQNGHDVPLPPIDVGSFDPANPSDIAKVIQKVDTQARKAEEGLVALSEMGTTKKRPEVVPPPSASSKVTASARAEQNTIVEENTQSAPVDLAAKAKQSVAESNNASSKS